MLAMAQRKLRFRMGPNPQDQNEEREARVTAILERLHHHRDKVVILQPCPHSPIARVVESLQGRPRKVRH